MTNTTSGVRKAIRMRGFLRNSNNQWPTLVRVLEEMNMDVGGSKHDRFRKH